MAVVRSVEVVPLDGEADPPEVADVRSLASVIPKDQARKIAQLTVHFYDNDSSPPNGQILRDVVEGRAVANVELPKQLLPRIVHQDDDLLVVDKPAGLAVQPGSGHDVHLLAWLDAQPFGTRTRTYRPAPAHRRDRGTEATGR